VLEPAGGIVRDLGTAEHPQAAAVAMGYIRAVLAPEEHARATLWIVDDSPLEAELARKALAPAFDAEVFHDASAMLERFAAGERPTVLVVDWYMPNISGIDVCTFVRTVADSAELPIIVLTATGTEEDLLRGLAAGANDFVTKPFRVAELTARVTSLAEASRRHHRLQRAELDLRDEAAFREKFIAILAHDLRQPLNVFAMGTGLLESSASMDARLNAISTRLANAASRMQRMLDELLDFSRSRHHDGIPVNRAPSDIAEVAERVVDEVRHANPDRELVLNVTGDCFGDWDADRIAQVFSNLIANALQHGTPTCAVAVEVRGDGEGVNISVENACPPIPPSVRATIFDPFRQAAPSRSGLGLGLYIVRAIVRAHGGDVAVESDETSTRFVARVLRTAAPTRAYSVAQR